MSKYTSEAKATALEVLAATNNVATASLVTGVPQRTLYRWQHCQRLEGKLPPLSPKNTSLPLPSGDNTDASTDAIIDEVLDQLLEQARVLVKRFSESFDQASPVSQMMAVTRLIDRIIKLDARKPRTGKPLEVVIRHVDDDSDDLVPLEGEDDSDWSPSSEKEHPPHPHTEAED